MDAREFALFLKKKLLDAADGYNEILYSMSYKTMEEGSRIAGNRETLVSIADSIEGLLKEFHKRND